MASEAFIRETVKSWNAEAKKKDRDAETIDIKRIDSTKSILKLEYIDEVVLLNFPANSDSIWYCTSPDWLSGDLNASILAGMLSFNQILSCLASKVEKRVLTGSLQMSGSDDLEASSLSSSAAALGVSGMYEDGGDSNFALSLEEMVELKQHVAEAQGVLGEDHVTLVPELGSVKLVLDIYSLLSEPIAKSLGLFQDEPVFVSLSFEKSSTPLVSCTQRQSPGFGVKNHLKSIFDHFFNLWNNDREKLKKVGRPPQGFTAAADAAAATSAPPAIAGASGNDNNKPAAEVEKPKTEQKPWWKTWFGGNKASISNEIVVLTEDSIKVVMEMGFDAIASVQALVESKNDADKATMLVVNKPGSFEGSKKQLDALNKLVKLGISAPMAAAALVKCKGNADEAFSLCKEKPQDCFKLVGSSKSVSVVKGKMVKKSAGGNKTFDSEEHPYNKENFIFALMSFLEERLGHYSSYCVCCHAPHSCFNPDGGVVCSEALCVFQLEESPMEKLMSVHLCPFKDCCDLDLSTVGKEFMGMPLDTICKSYGLTSQQLLEMLLHRYLPTDQIKLMLENGLKTCQCKRLESVLNPKLCARFEHRWKALREKHGGDKSVRVAPCVAYHGTSEAAVKGILETGFLLNKLSQGSGDNGWFGCGIYFSQYVQTALGYSRCRQMLVCAVLMGKVYKCPGRMDGAKLVEGYDSHEDPSGYEWVIYHEESILPVYVVHY